MTLAIPFPSCAENAAIRICGCPITRNRAGANGRVDFGSFSTITPPFFYSFQHLVTKASDYFKSHLASKIIKARSAKARIPHLREISST